MAARHPDMTASVNHSWHTPLLTRPIGINIETKRTGDGWDTAVVQLGIWVAAQFVKLEQLIHDFDADPNQIPFLPIVVVQGHEWYFLAASRGDFGQTVRPSFPLFCSSVVVENYCIDLSDFLPFFRPETAPPSLP